MNEWVLIVSFLSGGFVSTATAHFLTVSRERRDRKDALCGHLGRWLGALDQPQADVQKVHAEFAPHVKGYCARLKRDFFFFRRADFMRLCEVVSMAQPTDDDYRAKIQKLISFV
jgi:hypothetical protein